MTELIKKTETELRTLLLEKKKTLRDFRFNIAGSNLKDVKEGKSVKKDIARILTELSARAKRN